MNKKPFILLSSLLLLSGCATYNEITEPKQVREKMQQIEASQEGFSLKNVTLTSTIKTSNNKASTEARTETIISIDNKYVSTTLYMKAVDDGQVSEATTKAYSYIKDNYYYFATETTTKDEAQKIYAQSEIDPNKIDTIFDELELDIDEIEKSIGELVITIPNSKLGGQKETFEQKGNFIRYDDRENSGLCIIFFNIVNCAYVFFGHN